MDATAARLKPQAAGGLTRYPMIRSGGLFLSHWIWRCRRHASGERRFRQRAGLLPGARRGRSVAACRALGVVWPWNAAATSCLVRCAGASGHSDGSGGPCSGSDVRRSAMVSNDGHRGSAFSPDVGHLWPADVVIGYRLHRKWCDRVSRAGGSLYTRSARRRHPEDRCRNVDVLKKREPSNRTTSKEGARS